MKVTFEVAGTPFAVPEQQATILAENLRILAKSRLSLISQSGWAGGVDSSWRAGASELADSIENTLVQGHDGWLRLEGGAAAATHCVLRLMVGLDGNGAAGLRDARGAPVEAVLPVAAASVSPDPSRHLARPELLELLGILFVLALVTVIAGIEWTSSWYITTPVIAALVGVRAATTRVTGRFAWSVASVLWWAVFLIPAAVLVVLAGLLIAATTL